MRSKVFTVMLVGLLSLSFVSNTLIGAVHDSNSLQNLAKKAQMIRSIQVMLFQQTSGNSYLSNQLALNGPQSRSQVMGSGGIAGTVTGMDDEAIGRALVEVFPADSIGSDGEWSKGIAIVEPDGTYRIDGLVAGNYYVSAWADGYLYKYYDNVLDINEATHVTVNENAITDGIDFVMEKITPGTGSISGKVVSEADESPITGAIVSVYSPDNPWQYGMAETDEAGLYRITELKTGSYYAVVYAEGYLSEIYDNAETFDEVDLIEVIEPNETPHIDFALSIGGSISGLVTDEDGEPIARVQVEAIAAYEDSLVFNWDLEPRLFGGSGKAVTDENGEYTITGLPTGDYWVLAQYTLHWAYFTVEWYDNATNPLDATPVPVVAGEEVTGINFQLSLEVPAGVIAGRVTDMDDNPIADAFVQLQPADDGSTHPGMWTAVTTDKDGNYRMEYLPDGSYFVSACAHSDWQYVCRWWPDAEDIEDATAVVVENEIDVGPIDFKLPVTCGTASIAGTVTSSDGQAIEGASIRLSLVDPMDSSFRSRWDAWAFGYTDSSGNYQIDRLPAGEYIAYASHWEDENYAQQWYDHAESLEEATSIFLSDNEARTDIHFTLTLKPIYGSIAGTVVDSVSGLPIRRAYVEVSPIDSDRYIGVRPFFYWSYYAITDENGAYQIDWLWESDYIVSVYANGAFEYFKDVTAVDQATPVSVTGGNISEVNFDLVPRDQGSGMISGSVLSEWEETPLEIAVVTAYPEETIDDQPFSEKFYTAVTDTNGYYEMKGLPPGNYYLMSFGPYTIGEYYDDVYDPYSATVVSVDGVIPTTGIDFTLNSLWFWREDDWHGGAFVGGTIFGKVTDDSGRPLSGATVYVLNESGQAIASIRTNANGTYELIGLPPGNYVLQVGHFGFISQYNGNVDDFSQATPLQIGTGTVEVNFVLATQAPTGVNAESNGKIPDKVQVYGNYPNPFNPETCISFALPQTMHVTLRVFNLYGEQVAQLHNGPMNAGDHELTWNGRNEAGQPVTSGLYIYRLESDQETQTGKMMLLR